MGHQETRLWGWIFLAGFMVGCFEEKEWADLPLADQDINPSESDVADRAIDVLLGLDNIQMVMCRRNDIYEVHSREGKVFFQRVHGDERWEYPLVLEEGKNPLARQDPMALPDLESELAAGDNPMQTDYREQDSGYSGPEDPRISFIKEENVSYPLAYERIAAAFDSDRAGDLIVEFTPWGWYPLGESDGHPNPGAHGQLSVVASRGVLLFAGKGVHQGKIIESWARSVDIAPTIAKAMGLKKTFGVDGAGHTSHEVYFKWQDGQVLEDVLDGETPKHVLVIVDDALTNSELLYQLGQDPEDHPLPSYRWMMEHGTLFQYGAVVNFPSNTAASHNTIVTGAYSGHHNLIDNWYYERIEKSYINVFVEIFNLSDLLSDQVETLHEAVHRSFPGFHPQNYPLGDFTVAITSPGTKGADLILTEAMQPMDWPLCPKPQGLPYPNLDMSLSRRAQGVDDLGVDTTWKAYAGTRVREDGKEVRCAQLPRFGIINLTLTDDVAHETGTHSDGLRKAIVQTDQRQQILFDTLKQMGVFEDTLFVLTSDHGQYLQDINRNKDFKPALDAAGIRYVATNAFIYLLTLDVELSTQSFTKGEATRLEITVKDDDTQEPVEAAAITVESGTESQAGETDSSGQATIEFTPAAETTRIMVVDEEYTAYDKTF